MTYKLIQECGLHIHEYNNGRDYKSVGFVKASDLEAFLSKAVRVYGQSELDNKGDTQDLRLSKQRVDNGSDRYKDTHSGLLINYKPIPKLEPVSKEEILETIQNAGVMMDEAINKVIERIEKAGIK